LIKAIYPAVCLAGLVAAAPSPAADSLGRLFFTPAQRSVLDAGKSMSKAAPVTPRPRTVIVNGVVIRSDSERTVWINGKAYHSSSPDGVQVKTSPATPGTTSIRVPGAGASARVKVGQQLDVNSGQVRENFSRRPAPVRSPAAAADIPAAPADNSVPDPAGLKNSRTTKDAVANTGEKSTDTPPPPAR
jgi:hypothetical protein